uniref:hypothetical protein n=1 Tax=Alistipes putredinis TaxID=28117 RepID=UPI003FD710C5
QPIIDRLSAAFVFTLSYRNLQPKKIRHFSFSDFNSFLQSLHFVQNNGQNAISRHTSIFLLLRNSVHRKYIFK